MQISELELLQARETIVCTFYHQTNHDVAAAERFDEVVCATLKIDVHKHPPDFFADEFLLGV